jgi:hypothetical protein
MALTRFRLDGGTNQQAARKLLPTEGLLRRVVNLRLRRDNELGVRPGFTALATGVYAAGSSTLVAHDLLSYDDRLFALGHLSGAGTANRITLFEYVGEVKGWKETSTHLPSGTRLREIGSPPDQSGGVKTSTVAVYNGIAVHAYSVTSATVGLVYALVFRTRDDATLVFEHLPLTGAAVALVTVGHKFYVFGLDAGTGLLIQACSFTASTDQAFSTALLSLTTDKTVFAACAVAGATGGYVVVYCLAGDILVKHFNDSNVQQMTRTINATVPNYLAVAADSTANVILIGYLDNADSLLKYKTISLTAGTDIAGPTTLSATATTGAITVFVDSGGGVTVAGNITSTTPRKAVFVGTQVDTATWSDLQLATEMLCTSIAPINLVFAGFSQGTQSFAFGVSGMGVQDVQSYPVWFRDFDTAFEFPGRVGSLTRDSVSGYFYSTSLRQNNDLECTAAVAEWSYGVAERRQAAVQGGLLHIAGSLPLIFDGRFPFEISWGEKPIVYSLASSNTVPGAITSSAAYFIQVFPEMVDARGNVHRGPPSIVYSITTGAADDTITGTIGGLHSFRNSGFWDGSTYRIVICRTAALADKTAGENLYRETHIPCPSSSSNWGAAISFTLTTSDAALRTLGETQGTIYTQGQTPIPHQAPPPASYLWATNERLAIGGLPRTNQWLQSKLKFPAEATHFSDADLPQYQGSTDEAILAVASIGGQLVAFTRRTISLWTGTGPDHSGQGEFTFSGFLSREGGINGVDGWKSLCETDAGIFFQRDDEQLCFLGERGEVDWTVGQAIRDELVTYPVVLASCYLRKQNAVAFAVENSAANAGEVLVYDLRRKAWFIDDVYAKALAEYQGRLCYVDSAGAVFQQHATPGTGAMPNQSFETFDFDFGTGMSWGEIVKVGVVGTKIADCTATLDITFDSGLNYPTIETFTLTTANNYVANAAVNLEKAPPLRECSRFGLRFNVTGGSGTEGIRINEITLETTTAPGMARLPARDTH